MSSHPPFPPVTSGHSPGAGRGGSLAPEQLNLRYERLLCRGDGPAPSCLPESRSSSISAPCLQALVQCDPHAGEKCAIKRETLCVFKPSRVAGRGRECPAPSIKDEPAILTHLRGFKSRAKSLTSRCALPPEIKSSHFQHSC